MSDNIFICKICNKSFNNIYSFFDRNGNFRCPFNSLNEDIQNEYNAKYQCMLDNNIKILRKKRN